MRSPSTPLRHSCYALELVQTSINTSAFGYETTTDVGSVLHEEDQQLFAQALEGEEQDYLLFTNRSDTPHRVTPIWDGRYIERSGQLQWLAGEAPQTRNCLNGQANLDADETCADIHLSAITAWDPTDPIVVPKWSVVRLALPRHAAALDAPTGLNAVVASAPRPSPGTPSRRRSLCASLQHIAARDDLDGYHPIRASLDATSCASSCSLTLTNLAHDVTARANGRGHRRHRPRA